MKRDNAQWLADLASEGPPRDAALRELRQLLTGALRRALGRRADDAIIEDTVQEALIRVLEAIGSFEGRSRFTTWATSIAIHAAMSELRRRRWRDVSLDRLVADAQGGENPYDHPSPEEPPEKQLRRKNIVDRMYTVIRQDLSERQRTALLAELKGMPLETIAQQLGSNRNAVYKLTHDARKKLKRGLLAAGYAAEDILEVLAR